jgi:hypothetical protein
MIKVLLLLNWLALLMLLAGYDGQPRRATVADYERACREKDIEIARLRDRCCELVMMLSMLPGGSAAIETWARRWN